MKNVNIVLKGLPKSKYGYLKLSVRQNGKTTINSLDIKVLKKDFNIKTQRIRSSANEKDLDNKSVKEINDFLNDKILQYSNNPFSLSKIKCICQFMKIVIGETENIGTKEKYSNILRLFQCFIKEEYSKEDLEFDLINSSVIINFYKYLRKDKIVFKRIAIHNTRNTANYKIKALKSFFSKIEDRGIYKFYIDPFKPLKLKFDDTKKDFLSLDEFNKFLTHKPREFRSNTKRAPILYELEDIQESFIFSCLAQGLRVSDILTLRLNDFVIEQIDTSIETLNIFIYKKMFKTKKNVVVYLNSVSAKFIEKQLIKLINKFLPDYKTTNSYIYYIKDIEEREQLFNESHDFFLKSLLDGSFNTEPYKIARKKLDMRIDSAVEFVFRDTISIIKELQEYSELKTLFLFPFLSNDKFKNVGDNNDFGFIDEKQYLELIGKRGYVNNLLKQLFIQAGINKDYLTFHSARHTYTTLLLDNEELNINIYDLQKSLGHHSILSTQNYIRNFNTNKLKNINLSITNRLKIYDRE